MLQGSAQQVPSSPLRPPGPWAPRAALAGSTLALPPTPLLTAVVVGALAAGDVRKDKVQHVGVAGHHEGGLGGWRLGGDERAGESRSKSRWGAGPLQAGRLGDARCHRRRPPGRPPEPSATHPVVHAAGAGRLHRRRPQLAQVAPAVEACREVHLLAPREGRGGRRIVNSALLAGAGDLGLGEEHVAQLAAEHAQRGVAQLGALLGVGGGGEGCGGRRRGGLSGREALRGELGAPLRV
jgi:hypothetical protein